MDRNFKDGFVAGNKGSSPINRPPMNKRDDAEWLAGWTEGIKEFRRSLPRLGSAFETDGMRRGCDARQVHGRAGY